MSAPYQVWIDHGGDHEFIDADTIPEAVEKARAVPVSRWRRVRIIGDGYDAEFTSEGPRECSDGLSDEERELVEEAGYA